MEKNIYRYYKSNINNKIKFLLIIFLFSFLIFDFYLSSQINENNIMHFYKIPGDFNISTKDLILKMISNSIGRTIKSFKSIFCSLKMPFGNQILTLNNIICACEILKCKKIILDKRYFWYIKNKIVLKNLKINIIVDNISNYLNSSTIKDKTINFIFLGGKYRMILLKNEIIKNLPKIKTNPKDMYIYIRSGYLGAIYHKLYFQPPLCYYKKIIDNKIYNKIFIIAKDKTNKIIDILLSFYPNLIFNENSIELDIAFLANAYNVVGTVSTFLYAALRLNDNLKHFWQYGRNTYYYLNNNKTTYYLMDFSKEYIKNIYEWKYNSSQIKLMIKDKCPNNFRVILMK